MSPPLFDGMIVSRPSVAARSLRRVAGTALALSLHLTALGLLLLAPLLGVEMVQPPRASILDRITIVQPSPRGRPDGDGVPAPRVRAGGGIATRRATAPDRTPAAAKAPPDIARPPRLPLDPPDPQEPPTNDTTVGTARPIEGAPPGPGMPDGHGTSEIGTDLGCEGCRGHGEPGDGTSVDDGEGDGPVYAWDSRVDPPLLIPSSRALPRYPDIARRAGVQGSVILMIAIDADGTVGEVQVLRSPNERWGFDESAIVAVKRWRYRPARMHGRAVAVYAQVMVEFTLSR